MLGETNKTVLLTIKGSDQASNVINKVGSTSKTATKTMSVNFKAAAIAAAAVTAAVTATTAALISMASRAGKMTGVTQGFERNFGNATDALGTLRTAAQGTISDFDLMASSNKAALLGVTTSVDDLAGLMVTARLRARELGIDATQAFDDIVTGIGRQSPLILDNLGIKIPDALKTMMTNMTEAEQTQLLLNYAIADGADLASQYGDVQLTASDRVEILKTKVENLKDNALVKLEPVLDTVVDKMGNLVEKASDAADELLNGTTPAAAGLKWALTDEGEGLIPAIKRVGSSFNEMINSITGDNYSALENFETMLAGWAYILGKIADLLEDIIDGFNNAIKKARELESTDYYKSYTEEGSAFGNGGGGTWLTGGIVEKRATGGSSSQWTLVGERGAELVNLPNGSHVYSHEDSKNMMGGGDIIININSSVYGVDNLKQNIINAVTEATARQNQLANYNLAL